MKLYVLFFCFGFSLVGLYFKTDVFFYLSYALLLVSSVSLGLTAYTKNLVTNPPLPNNGIKYRHRACAVLGGIVSYFVTPFMMSLFV